LFAVKINKMELLGYIIIGLSLLWLSRYLLIRSKVAFKLITVFLVGALIFSQFINNHRQSHPLANWSMYSSPNPAGQYKEYLLVNENGHSFHYPFELVNRINQRPFMTLLSDLDDEYHRLKSKVPCENYDSGLEEMVKSLIYVYRKSYPEQKLAKFKINVVKFDVNSLPDHQLERFNSYTYHIR